MPPDASIAPNYQRIELWAAIFAVGFFAVLIEAIRRNRLKERYSLLWFAATLGVGVLIIKRDWLEAVAFGLGIHYPPNALFLIAVGFMAAILFHFSTVVSGLLNERTALAQRVGILDAELSVLRRELEALQDARDDQAALEGADRLDSAEQLDTAGGEPCEDERADHSGQGEEP